MHSDTPKPNRATAAALCRTPAVLQALASLDALCWRGAAPAGDEVEALLMGVPDLTPWRWHLRRVGELARLIALAAGWSPRCSEWVLVYGLVHDVGKAWVRPEVLARPGTLSPRERRHVERHAQLGARALGRCRAPHLHTAARVALEHHERWDGSGYPHGIAGGAIHPAARVVAIADVYDALTSTRAYREPLDQDAAVAAIRTARGSLFDPALADAFLRTAHASLP
jgi:putative two-component system response regulator